jgi:hypothetical protein
LQVLEDRIVPAIYWNNPSGGLWDVGSNWQGGSAPGMNDIAIINTPNVTVTIQSGDSISVQGVNTAAGDTLSITGGSLMVTSGGSVLSGALSMTGGALTATGAGVTFSANGTTSVSSASLYAKNGATVSLPGMTSYTNTDTTSNTISVTFQADGSGSVLDISALSSLTEVGYYAFENLDATNGGTLKLKGCTSLAGHVYYGGQSINITDTGGSSVLDSNLTTLDQVDVTLDGTDAGVANAWTSFTKGSLKVIGGSYNLTGLTNIDGSSLDAEGNGTTLAVTKVTSYSQTNSTVGAYFRTSGIGASTLDVSGITNLGTFSGAWFVIAGVNNSTVKLSKLASINQPNYQVDLAATGGGSQLDVSALTSFTAGPGQFEDTSGGVIVAPVLASFNGVTIIVDGSEAAYASAWTSVTNGSLQISGGTYLLSNLTDFDYASVQVTGGATVTMSKLTSYSGVNAQFAISGASTLDMSALTTLGTLSAGWLLYATGGSTLNLSGLTTVNQPNVSVSLQVGGTGSQINLSGLTSLAVANGSNTAVNTGGELLWSQLTSLNGFNVSSDGTDADLASAWTNFTHGSLTLTGHTYNLTALTDIDNSSLYVQNGASLALPNLVSYSETYYTTFEATGASSMLNLSALSMLGTVSNNWIVEALAGGTVDLSGLPAIDEPNANLVFSADGTNSVLKLPNVATFSGNAGTSMTVSNNADINTVAGTLTIPQTASGVTLTVPALPWTVSFVTNGTLSGGPIFNISAGHAISLGGGAFTGGTVFNVGAGATVNVTSGTFTGGVTFNVGAGANVDLTSNGSLTYSGLLTGSGAGAVHFSGGGTINVGLGGLTLNFAGSMFQWTGGILNTRFGNVTNLGTMNLSSTGGKIISNDGTLDNFGTIIQSGTNLSLHSDNVVGPTTLLIEPGAAYLLQSDTGIDNQAGGFTALINHGLIRKTAGTGTSQLLINTNPISNTGTIEVDSGTLYLNASGVSQVSGTTLTGGTWEALNGAKLQFPTGTNITDNQASIALSGSGATITGIAGLGVNEGSFSLTNGANFATVGNFTNSGNLTAGAGSTLTVNGSFTQTSAGTLNDQIGGTPASGLFGQVNATGSASLGGGFDLTLVSSFTPSTGQTFPVMAFASSGGNFSSVQGLSSFTEVLNATTLDLATVAPTAQLAASAVSAPPTATIGQDFTVTWQVTNEGGTAASGNWQDAVYVSPTPDLSTATLLGIASHTGGLAAGKSYLGSLTAAFPALLGQFYVIVEADNDQQVPQGSRAADVAVSAATVSSDAQELPNGTTATGTLSQGQTVYYRVDTVAGQDLQINLSSDTPSAINELYASFETLPTRGSFDFSYSNPVSANQQILIPADTVSDTYYLMIYGRQTSASESYTISAAVPTFAVTGVDLAQVGNTGPVSFKVQGSGFDGSATFQLTDAGAVVHNATQQVLSNSTSALVTFDLTGAAPGAASLSVSDGGATLAVPQATSIVAGGGGHLSLNLIAPGVLRPDGLGTWTVQYSNTGTNDLPVPFLLFGVPGADFLGTAPTGDNLGSYVFLMGIPQGDFYDVLRPGESGQVSFYGRLPNTAQSYLAAIDLNAPVLSQIPTGAPADLGANYSQLFPVLQSQLVQLVQGSVRYQDVSNLNGLWNLGQQPVFVGNPATEGGAGSSAGTSSGSGSGTSGDPGTQVIILASSNYPPGNLGPLPGSAKTATDLANYFHDGQGIDSSNIHVISNGTSQDFGNTVAAIPPGSNVVVWTLGHGKQADGSYVFPDGTSLSPDQMSTLVNNQSPSQQYWFLDHCYAGGDHSTSLQGPNSFVASASTKDGYAFSSGDTTSGPAQQGGNWWSESVLNNLQSGTMTLKDAVVAAGNTIQQHDCQQEFPIELGKVGKVVDANANSDGSLIIFYRDQNGNSQEIDASSYKIRTNPDGTKTLVLVRNENQFPIFDQSPPTPVIGNQVDTGKHPFSPYPKQQSSPQNGWNNFWQSAGQGLIGALALVGGGPVIAMTLIHRAFDPNSITGPAGFGSSEYLSPSTPFGYTINFQNEPTATAAAQTVTVNVPIDPNLNAASVRLGSLGFGSTFVALPPNLTYYQTKLDLTSTLGVDVEVTGSVDVAGRMISWQFTTIDPATGQPTTDPLQGFLPPDDSSRSGEGFVTYYAMQNPNLPTGTTISEQASIVFDTNAAIATNQYSNTIDGGAPTSSVNPLPATEPTSFKLAWSGSDSGSGIAFYDIYVSDNGGAPTLYLTAPASQTSATFTGALGHTYGFYSVATDNVGNVQPTPTIAQVTTKVVATPTLTTSPGGTVAFGSGAVLTDSATLAGGNSPTGTITFTLYAPDGVTVLDTEMATVTDNGSYSTPMGYLPTAVGTYDWVASYSGDGSNGPVSTGSAAETVSPGSQTITFGPLANQTYGNAPFTVTATASSGLPVSLGIVSGSQYASISGSTITILGATPPGVVVTVEADQAGNSNYTAATAVQQSFTIAQASQSITFGALANQTYGNAPFNVSATASSGLAVGFSIVAGNQYASISGNTITILGATPPGAVVTVEADQAGNSNYSAATAVQQSFSIAQASQTISFGALANQTYGNAPFNVSASASSGLAVSFSIVAGSQYASISGNTITILGATPPGAVVTVEADQAGNSNYSAAAAVQQSFSIAQASQTISFGALASQTYGNAPFNVSATASSGLPVGFSIVAGNQYASLSGNTITILGATPPGAVVTVEADQAGNVNYSAAAAVQQSFTIAQASQAINFGALANQTYGNAPFTVSATASSGLAVGFSIVAGSQYASLTGNTITILGATPPGAVVSVEADQAGNVNYSAAAAVQQSFTIAQASQSITFGALANQTYGNAPFTVSATASSGLAVGFSIVAGSQYASISGSTITILGATPPGVVVTVEADQAGNSNYSAAAAIQQSFSIAQASQSITFGALANQTYGNAPFTVSATASSGLAVGFSIVAGSQYASISGNTISILGATPSGAMVTVEAEQAGNANYSAAAAVQQSFSIAKANQTIVVTQPAPGSAIQGASFAVAATASSGLPVDILAGGAAVGSGSGSATISINGASGTGTVTFSQSGNADYNAATAVTENVTITSSTATPTITVTPGDTVVIGTGGRLTASAALYGGNNPSGKITFTLYGPSNSVVYTEIATVGGNGTCSTPAGYLPSTAGTYQWVASYSGDNSNKGVSSTNGSAAEIAVGSGATVVGSTLYLVGGQSSNDHIHIHATGTSETGSTGIEVRARLNGSHIKTTYSQSFSAIVIVSFGGSDHIVLDDELTIPTTVSLGNGNDRLHLGSGNNTVTLGAGNDEVWAGNGNNTVRLGSGNDVVAVGNGNNRVTVGNGNDSILAGNGNNVIVEGNGNDFVFAGNGNNLIVAGLGRHLVLAGNGRNILIDGAVSLTQSGDTLGKVLSDWTLYGDAAANVAGIRARLQVTDNTKYANALFAGKGLDWFWDTDPMDMTNRKSTDLLN